MDDDEEQELAALLFNPVLGSFVAGWAFAVIVLYTLSGLTIIPILTLGFFAGAFCAYIAYERSGVGPDIS